MVFFYESEDENDFKQLLTDNPQISYINHYKSSSRNEIAFLLKPIRSKSKTSYFIGLEDFDTQAVSRLFWEFFNCYFPEKTTAKIKLRISEVLLWYEFTIKKGCDIVASLCLYEKEHEIFSILENGSVFFCLDEFESPRHIAELAFYFLYIPEDEKYDRAEAEADLITLSKVIMQPENIEKLKQELASLDKKLDPLRVRERLNKYIPDKTELEIKQSLTNSELRQLDKLLFFYP
ncbi:hypothetical protein Q4519_07150 [Motilimonas sp. 1_MG-2023]|uniref:hypothetical protein n=1 Tax=Motilimonas sp. 1_MG-2023 TaxID=3062672 RepID=UPI0026E42E6C|nr:hypothetical protein [Motilimonas sp. 1_MG-2023]MDO6525459.1 hypothetical protein [Motilimonas sp. 1_MG-2023]